LQTSITFVPGGTSRNIRIGFYFKFESKVLLSWPKVNQIYQKYKGGNIFTTQYLNRNLIRFLSCALNFYFLIIFIVKSKFNEMTENLHYHTVGPNVLVYQTTKKVLAMTIGGLLPTFLLLLVPDKGGESLKTKIPAGIFD